MAITWAEKAESRTVEISGDERIVTCVYLLGGTSDDATAYAMAYGFTATGYDGLVRDSIALEPIWVDENALDGAWTVTVRYCYKTAPATGESAFAFDTGGGTQHITQAITSIARYPADTAPDFAGAIGVTHDSVEGVDITVPVYQFSETHYLAAAAVTDAYKMTLFALTGKVNNATFRGLAAGECLFLGASGQKRGMGDWEITFKFAGSPNVSNLTIGSITGINKKGWEYLWVRYADSEDETAKTLVKKPASVHVEQVYPTASFAGLGIG